MPLSALNLPVTDPTPIFELYRGNLGTELLVAAVSHFNVFDLLAKAPLAAGELGQRLGLAPRATTVLTTALRAFKLLEVDAAGRFAPSALAREHLLSDAHFAVRDYLRLGDSPGVLGLVERLRSNQPAGAKKDQGGAAFIYREGIESAMEQEASARRLTLALAGRAKNVAPHLAQRVPLDRAKLLLDIGGGTGIYSIAFLQKNPALRAIVWDRPEVLKVAREMGEAYGVADRLECRPGDMFADPVPTGCDAMLLSNILHDWDVPECRTLVRRAAAALPVGGRLMIHDVFLNDALDGPLPVALYSCALFCVCEGRAYSAGEYRGFMETEGLKVAAPVPTLVHCGVMAGTK